MPNIEIQTIVSQQSGRARICLRLEGRETQLSFDEAESFAHALLGAAHAAYADEFLLSWATENTNPEAAISLLRAFRAFREANIAKPNWLEKGNEIESFKAKLTKGRIIRCRQNANSPLFIGVILEDRKTSEVEHPFYAVSYEAGKKEALVSLHFIEALALRNDEEL